MHLLYPVTPMGRGSAAGLPMEMSAHVIAEFVNKERRIFGNPGTSTPSSFGSPVGTDAAGCDANQPIKY